MSEQIIARLIEFAESGNQQKILLNGQAEQGWVVEISPEHLTLSTGFSEKHGKDLLYTLESLKQAELFFWDAQHSLWRPFSLD